MPSLGVEARGSSETPTFARVPCFPTRGPCWLLRLWACSPLVSVPWASCETGFMATATARAGRCCSTPSPRAPKTYRTSFKTSGTIGRQTSTRGTDQRTSSTRAASGTTARPTIDREADGYGHEDQREDNVPLDDSTWGECSEGRLADDRRLQDMVDATPAVVIRCAWEADGRVGNSKHGILRRRCFQRGIRPRPCRGLCHRVAGAGERPGAQRPSSRNRHRQ